MIITDKNGIKVITGKAFRLIYVAKQHITTIEGTVKSKTWTKQEVEEFVEVEEVSDRIKELKLIEVTER